MLVLARKINEGIMISDNIEIKILSIEDGKVKIGIHAPKHIKIYRKEILENIKKENIEALSANKDILNFLKK